MNGQKTDWAVALLAFMAKPEGGTDYAHTVAIIEAKTHDEIGDAAIGIAHREYPSEQGWTSQQCVVMPLPVTQVYTDVRAERIRQDAKHGGPTHDDTVPATGWCDRLSLRIHKALGTIYQVSNNEQDYRRRMVQVAALAVAAIEAFDRGGSLN